MLWSGLPATLASAGSESSISVIAQTRFKALYILFIDPAAHLFKGILLPVVHQVPRYSASTQHLSHLIFHADLQGGGVTRHQSLNPDVDPEWQGYACQQIRKVFMVSLLAPDCTFQRW